MSARSRHSTRVAELIAQDVPFVEATVVRAQCPTSARPGDAAVVLADGTIEGFIGGQCAEGSVRIAAMTVLASGEALLLRVLPDAESDANDAVGDGAMTVVNPCLSGGAIEVFLEPKLPAARLVIVGSTPIAHALAELGAQLGFGITQIGDEEPNMAGCTATIISSHGRGESEAIEAGLAADVGFIGLVASHARGDAVVAGLDLTPDERRRVHTPVGIDIGARTAEEVALSILAEVVRAIRREGLTAPVVYAPALPESTIDPICGMTVTVTPTTPHLHAQGADHWYCNPGCRTRHAEELGVA